MKNREIDTSYWLGTDDIGSIVEIVAEIEHGGFQENCQYLLKNRFPLSSNKPDNTGLVVLLPPTDGKNAEAYSFTGLEYYLNIDYQPAGAIDAFDEIFASIRENDNVRILSPHNISGNHWGCSEINIAKQENKFVIDCFFHNPFGGGVLNTFNNARLSEAIIQSISHHISNADIEINFNNSPYPKRQVDGASCGVHTIVDMFDRVLGIEPTQKLGYGAKDKRSEFINLVEMYKPDQFEKFAERNTKIKRISSGSSYIPNSKPFVPHTLNASSSSSESTKPTSSSQVPSNPKLSKSQSIPSAESLPSTSKPVDNNVQKVNEVSLINSNVNKIFSIKLSMYIISLFPTILSYIAHKISETLFKQVEYKKDDVKLTSNKFLHNEPSSDHTKNLNKVPTVKTR